MIIYLRVGHGFFFTVTCNVLKMDRKCHRWGQGDDGRCLHTLQCRKLVPRDTHHLPHKPHYSQARVEECLLVLEWAKLGDWVHSEEPQVPPPNEGRL